MTVIINNKEKSRFETSYGTEYAFIEYRWLEGNMAIMHTFVPESFRGKGVANELARYVLEYIKDHNLKAIVYCPFVTAYLKRHPEYDSMVILRKKD